MLKQTIKFVDYNDQEREVTEYFHLTEEELVTMQANSPEGIEKEMDDAIKSNDAGRVLEFIKMLVHKSYGRKSQDGIQFRKSPEILEEFINSAYYSDFLLGLIEDNGAKGVEFIQGIMPKKLLDRALAQVNGQTVPQPESKTYAPSAREQFAQRVSEPVNAAPVQSAPDSTQSAAPTTENIMTPDQIQAFLEWQNRQKAAENSEGVRTDTFRIPAADPDQQ